MTTAARILVIGPSWVGDMVMSQTLYKSLKQRSPQCQIDVAAPAWSAAILERMPEVNQLLTLPLKHGQVAWRLRKQLGKQLRQQHYDQAIVLPNSWKSALIPWWSKIPQRTGYRGEWRYGLLNDVRHLNKTKLPLLIQRYANLSITKQQTLGTQLPWPQLRVDNSKQAETLQHYGLESQQKILVLCPGAAFGTAKRWPDNYFAELARHYLAQDWQVWCLGGPGETALIQAIRQQSSEHVVDLSSTSLAEAIDLMALADLVISNDSGLMHIASALQRKSIVIYGSSDHRYTPPLNQHAKIINLELSCSPCFKRECPLEHLKCLNDITPNMVLQTAEQLCAY